MALNDAKIISITSVKGGVGKTIFSSLLANAYSKNKKVLLIDMDLYTGSIDVILNLKGTKDLYSLVDDMMNNRFNSIKDYVRKYNDNLDVLVSPLDPRSANIIKSNYINIILKRANLQYDYIIIDSASTMNAINSMCFDMSDYILYLMTNDLMSIKNMKTMINILNDMDIKNKKIVLNEMIEYTDYSKADVENLLEEKIDFYLDKNYYIKDIEKDIYQGKLPESMQIEKIAKEL